MDIEKFDGLTYEKSIEIFRYEPETGVLERKLKSGRWKVCGDKPTHSDGYGRVGIDGERYLAHRLIWLLTYGEWPENEIDHLDRDSLNNKIENLRVATRLENQHNQGVRKNNTSGYPGVHFHKQSNKYMAYINGNGRRIHLGLYPSAEEAFVAYMVAKIQCHPTSPISQEYLRELTLAG